MGKPRLLYYDVLEYDAESLATLDAEFDVIRLRTPDEDSPEILQGIDAMIAPLGFDCGKAKIDACPKLKAIGSSTTGAPHIDRKYAEEKGVKVIFLGPETEFLDTITCTAEHAWGLLLAVMRRSPWSFQAVQKGKWYRFDWPTPKMLCSLTLGIVGLGRLGRMVATFGKAFRMEVLYYDPYVPESPVPGCIRVGSPEELVSKSDVVSLHAHHTPETDNMFDRALFAKFRPGSYFINTARGELVDHAALLEALETGAMVHDIGKVLVPDHVLNKPGRLTDEEMELMKRHPATGYEILRSLRTFRDVLPIVRWHHERPDGTGYPDGIPDDRLPQLPRIVAVADCFDAISTDRPYRSAMPYARCKEVLATAGQEGALDRSLATTFVDMLDESPDWDQRD